MNATEATKYIRALLFSAAHRALYTDYEVDALHYCLVLLRREEVTEKPPASQLRLEPIRCFYCADPIKRVEAGPMAGNWIHVASALLGCTTAEGEFSLERTIAEPRTSTAKEV